MTIQRTPLLDTNPHQQAARNWLVEQRTNLDTPEKKRELIAKICQKPTSDIEPLSEVVCQTTEERNLRSRRTVLTNPSSLDYASVQNVLTTIAGNLPGTKIIYQSSKPEFKNIKRIAILIASDHVDSEVQLHDYTVLKALYTNPRLQMSSSFNEGITNAEDILDGMPTTLNEARLMSDLHLKRLAPEQVLLYQARNNMIQSASQSLPYLSFNQEKIAEKKEMDINASELIAIASGIHSTMFKQSSNEDYKRDIYNTATLTLTRLYTTQKAYQKKNIDFEFYSLLISRMNKIMSDLQWDENLSKTIIENAVNLVDLFSDAKTNVRPQIWKEKFNSLALELNNRQINAILEYIKDQSQKHTIQDRNRGIIELFSQAEPGTRAMIVGQAHIDSKRSGKHNLITLLEEAGIPVVVFQSKQL